MYGGQDLNFASQSLQKLGGQYAKSSGELCGKGYFLPTGGEVWGITCKRTDCRFGINIGKRQA